jgi:hypothetical protein
VRYILVGAFTSLLAIVVRLAGKAYDADSIKALADNGADLVLAGIQLWLYYRAYKARVNATKTISTAASVAATVENAK